MPIAKPSKRSFARHLVYFGLVGLLQSHTLFGEIVCQTRRCEMKQRRFTVMF
jgi:hypothetical protein